MTGKSWIKPGILKERVILGRSLLMYYYALRSVEVFKDAILVKLMSIVVES